jgi:hypothetical protein
MMRRSPGPFQMPPMSPPTSGVCLRSMDSTAFNGEVIGGFGKTITLMSGSAVTNPCNYSGPPQ